MMRSKLPSASLAIVKRASPSMTSGSGWQCERNEKLSGFFAIETISGSISKNRHFSPGFERQESEPAPRPITP